MNKKTLEKLQNIRNRFLELEDLMSNPVNASNPETIIKLAKEHNLLKNIVTLFNRYNNLQENYTNSKNIAETDSDPEIIELAIEEQRQLSDKLKLISEDLKESLIPKDIRDEAYAIVEVRAGTGGDAASVDLKT